ncbi:hypothetical protein GQ56_0112655 [Burkholderia paludis]|uniref:hypothetical protein n=1 Tax=Burkholderia paludis TaxID=1506587 RepID=UPI0004DB708C|nr:hypothetical protein [Burkholderia paludis]KFG96878.1 hypothetical protein GQ56_0112655 [Burkholderia paludis]
MLRLSICTAMLVCGAAFAAPPGDATSSAPAASNQVFPPLPPYASLPPGAGGDDEAQASAPAGGRHARRSRHAPPAKKAPEFQVHLVVTEASRAVLAAEDRKLDDALAKGARESRPTGAGAAALAMTQ